MLKCAIIYIHYCDFFFLFPCRAVENALSCDLQAAGEFIRIGQAHLAGKQNFPGQVIIVIHILLQKKVAVKNEPKENKQNFEQESPHFLSFKSSNKKNVFIK